MNHSLSDTNCTISSADLDPSDGINTVTVTSSGSFVPTTSDTHDTDNGPVTGNDTGGTLNTAISSDIPRI